MADSSAGAGADTTGGAPQQAAAPNIAIRAQYVKDLSFENPSAPQILAGSAERPKIDINVGIRTARMSESDFEVELQINAKAEMSDKPAFLIELKYAGVFALTNFPQEQIQPIVMIECPRLLFPFARQIIASSTRDGGFPPLMLEPIDFVALYRRQQQEAAARQAQAIDRPAGSA